MAVVQVVFTAHEPDPAGHMWVTSQVGNGERATIGYLRQAGDAVAAHGSGEGWPQVALCAGPAAALGALIGVWGQQVANSVQPEEMVEP